MSKMIKTIILIMVISCIAVAGLSAATKYSDGHTWKYNDTNGVLQSKTKIIPFQSATAYCPTVSITAANGDANPPYLLMRKNSTTPASTDYVGVIRFDANDVSANNTTFAQIVAQVTDATNSSEDGKLTFQTMTGGTLTDTLMLSSNTATFYGDPAWTSATSAKPSMTITNTNADANGATIGVLKTSASPANSDVVGNITFTANDASANATVQAKVIITQTDVSPTSEDASILFQTIKAASLTDTLLLSSGDTTTYGDVTMTSATASKPDVYVTNTNADANNANFVLYKNSASPANSDGIGVLRFDAKDSSANQTVYAKFTVTQTDATNTSEDGTMVLSTQKAGTLTDTMTWASGDTTAHGDFSVSSATSAKPAVTITNTNADANGATLAITKTSASVANSDVAGNLTFNANDSSANATVQAKIVVTQTDVTNTSEDASIDFQVVKAGTLTSALKLTAGTLTLDVATGNATITTGNRNISVIIGGTTYYIKAHTSQ